MAAGAGDDLLSARSEAAAGSALRIARAAGESAPGEATVGREVTVAQVAPAEAGRLLSVALVVSVAGALVASGIVPVPVLSQTCQ